MIDLREGDVVLCTVTKIVGTTVFVEIEGADKDLESTIITSEISSGRIRNLRDYVVPNKKIVCKILRIKGKSVDLSLRRVTAKERAEVMERYEKERACLNILKSVLGSKAVEIAEKIKKRTSLYNFLVESRETEKLKEFFSEEEIENLLKILNKPSKEKSVRKNFSLHSEDPNGITKIKNCLEDFGEISYLGGGCYSLKSKGKNFKEANLNLKNNLEKIEERAKTLGLKFLEK